MKVSMVVNVDKEGGGDGWQRRIKWWWLHIRTKNDIKNKEESEKTKLFGLCRGGSLHAPTIHIFNTNMTIQQKEASNKGSFHVIVEEDNVGENPPCWSLVIMHYWMPVIGNAQPFLLLPMVWRK